MCVCMCVCVYSNVIRDEENICIRKRMDFGGISSIFFILCAI